MAMNESSTTDPCRNCTGTTFEPLFHAGCFDQNDDHVNSTYELARCSVCGLVNTKGITSIQLDTAYSESYYGSPSKKFNAVFELVLQYLGQLRARRILKGWRANSDTQSTPSVLDIGCGRGKLLLVFQSLGAEITGIERTGFEVEENNLGFVQSGPLSDEKFSGRQYDIIVIWHALEHLDDLQGFFTQLRDHTESNGSLLLAVPNFSSFQLKIFRESWFHLDLPRHLVHFEADWLIAKLNESGFHVESVSHFDLVQNVYGFIQSSLNLIFPSSPNDYYRLLKFSNIQTGKYGPRFVMYTLISLLIAPFALTESLLAAIFRKGATIQIHAKLPEK